MIERTVAVGGATTRYIEEGRGRVVVLLHGATLGSSADDWRDIIPLLAANGFRAIAYDQPGFGTNDDPADHSLAFRQKFVLNFLEALEIAHAAVVGHSQSGRLALALALAPVGKIDAAVVLCTGSLLPPSAKRGGNTSAPEREPTLEETRALLAANVSDARRLTAEVIERFHRFGTGKNFHNALMRASSSSEPSRTGRADWELLSDASIPLMLIYGTNETGDVATRVLLARERYPQLPIYLLEKCGHFAQWDQPETLVRLLTDFLLLQHSASD